MINPKEFTQRDAINSLTGIKSSLSNLRKVVSLTYLLYLANKKKSSIVYAESKDSKIVLKQEYKSFIQHYLNNSEIIEKIDDNPLLTSQIESLYVGLTLMFAFGRISFENTSLSMTKERTGGIRYPKKIDFASNIMTLDLMLNADSEESVKATLLAWLQDQQLDNKIEQRISIFLNICIENNLFKLRHGEDDLYFQTEGIYKSLITGNEVSLESDEIVGPTRILNSMLRENLVPWLNFKKSLVTINEDHDFNIKEYSDIIATSLSIRDIKVDNHVENVSKEEDNNHNEKHLPLQQIYYGAPGTGKSHTINELTEGESVIRTTFHPDSDYSTFVGAYKPTMKEMTMRDLSGHPVVENGETLKEEKIVYEFVEQAFLQAYVKAWKNFVFHEGKKQYLVIEEINRGNCAQIFGDLFQLLDRNDYGFSDYPINADKDMQKFLKKAFARTDEPDKQIFLQDEDKERINQMYKGDEDVAYKVFSGEILLLPNNLYIWATMNTSDQSLFPIDSAFKRRWEWQYMPIGQGYEANGRQIKWAIEGATKKYDWWSFLQKINAEVGEATQSEDKKLGFFFCKATDGEISAEKFVGKVIFYLWNDVFKNNGFEGPIFKDVDGTELSFGKFYKSDMKGKAIVQKDKVELFLNNLGVEEANKGSYDNDLDSDVETDEPEDENDKIRLTIKFPDGEVVAGNTKFDSYLAAIKKIGLDKAEQIAAEKKYHRQGCALISKVEEQGILDAASYSYVQEEGYYIVKGMNGRTMRNMLNLLSQKLGLQLEVVYE